MTEVTIPNLQKLGKEDAVDNETKKTTLSFEVKNRSQGNELAKDLFGPRGTVWKRNDGLWAVGYTLQSDGRVEKGVGTTLEQAFTAASKADPVTLQKALDEHFAAKERWAKLNPVLAARKLYLEKRKKAANAQ